MTSRYDGKNWGGANCGDDGDDDKMVELVHLLVVNDDNKGTR